MFDMVAMTPAQCNEIIEDKLLHLKPLMESTLKSMKRISELLENGGINWRRALQRAKERVAASGFE